ncbi:unnamed protein product, partial [Iphiclides podalirius]
MGSRKLLALATVLLIIEVFNVHAQCNGRVEFINQPSAMPTITTTSYVQPVIAHTAAGALDATALETVVVVVNAVLLEAALAVDLVLVVVTVDVTTVITATSAVHLGINLVLAQAISGTCSGACAGYGFCGGFYPTVLDTSANTDPLDIILPVLLLAMCKKIGNAAEAPETKTPVVGAVEYVDPGVAVATVAAVVAVLMDVVEDVVVVVVVVAVVVVVVVMQDVVSVVIIKDQDEQAVTCSSTSNSELSKCDGEYISDVLYPIAQATPSPTHTKPSFYSEYGTTISNNILPLTTEAPFGSLDRSRYGCDQNRDEAGRTVFEESLADEMGYTVMFPEAPNSLSTSTMAPADINNVDSVWMYPELDNHTLNTYSDEVDQYYILVH